MWERKINKLQVHYCHRSTRHLHASVETNGTLTCHQFLCIPTIPTIPKDFQDTAWIVAGSRACSGNEVEWTAWPSLISNMDSITWQTIAWRSSAVPGINVMTPYPLVIIVHLKIASRILSLPRPPQKKRKKRLKRSAMESRGETSWHQGITPNPDVKMIETWYLTQLLVRFAEWGQWYDAGGLNSHRQIWSIFWFIALSISHSPTGFEHEKLILQDLRSQTDAKLTDANMTFFPCRILNESSTFSWLNCQWWV